MKSKSIKLVVLFFLTIVLALTTGCAYYNTFYNAKKFYKEAEKERKKREKTQIVELSPEEEARLRKSGRSGEQMRNRASQKEMQSYQQAIERASRVLEFYPDSKWVDDALVLLGRCFYYRRDYNKALRKFQEIQELYPDSRFISEVRLLEAKTYLGMDEYEIAEEKFRDISQSDEADKEVREAAKYELGGLYFQKGEYEQAAENYRSAAKEIDDKLYRVMSMYRLGECMLELNQFEEAPEMFKRAAKDAPNEEFKSQAVYKLGEAQSLIGKYDDAIKTFSDQLSKEYEAKRIPQLKLQLAHNYRYKGDIQEATKWYDNIIEEHKRTDASARSYYALAEIEEYLNQDYKKAKEFYDLVRAESSTSIIADSAKQRSDDIRTLTDLLNEIARLEGREVLQDSTAEGDGEGRELRADDAPIDLSPEGMWINYSGRDRPPPVSLRDLSEADLARQALIRERQALVVAGDSTVVDSSQFQPVELDSAALAAQEAEAEKQKLVQLADKYLSLAEVQLFSFNKPDSAIKYYHKIISENVDSMSTARAMYSLSYVLRDVEKDTSAADSLLEELVQTFPEAPHAEGARKQLGIPLMADKVDSARIFFKQAEKLFYDQKDLEDAFAIWDKIVLKYPGSPYAPKAAYAKAWHYENTLFQLDSAKVVYQELVEDFPESPFQDPVKTKLAAMERAIQEEEARQKAIQDSLAQMAAMDSTGADSLSQFAGMDSLVNALSADSLNQTLLSDSVSASNATEGPAPDPGETTEPRALPPKENTESSQESERRIDEPRALPEQIEPPVQDVPQEPETQQESESPKNPDAPPDDVDKKPEPKVEPKVLGP